MKVKMNEGMESKKLSGKLADSFENAIQNGDVERTIRYSMLILERLRGEFQEDDFLIDADALMDEFDDCESDVECVNACLDAFWDFCDEYGVVIDVDDKKDDDEIYIDSPESVKVEVEDDKKKKGD